MGVRHFLASPLKKGHRIWGFPELQFCIGPVSASTDRRLMPETVKKRLPSCFRCRMLRRFNDGFGFCPLGHGNQVCWHVTGKRNHQKEQKLGAFTESHQMQPTPVIFKSELIWRFFTIASRLLIGKMRLFCIIKKLNMRN